MQVKPHPALAHLVRHYLILDGLQPVGGIHRLFADGNTGMVFNLGNVVVSTVGNDLAVNSCWLYGQVKTFQDISVTGNINWMVVVLQPYGASHLWGVPAMEWVNCFFPAADVLHARIEDVCQALRSTEQLRERVQMLDHFLLREMKKCKEPDPIIVQAVNYIVQYQGLVPVEALLQTLFVSERTLERKFNQAIGISPKRFIDIVRLNISAKRLQQMKEKRRLTGIAYDSGYFDQAHFTKEFKKITGVTPQQYHEQVRPLALNFFQL